MSLILFGIALLPIVQSLRTYIYTSIIPAAYIAMLLMDAINLQPWWHTVIRIFH